MTTYLEVDPRVVTTASNCEGPILLVPRDQVYFWTEEWQEGERESAAAREAGNTVTFDSDDPKDITRWLLSED